MSTPLDLLPQFVIYIISDESFSAFHPLSIFVFHCFSTGNSSQEIPFALASAAAEAPPGAVVSCVAAVQPWPWAVGIAHGVASPGAPELLQEALDLGADPEALAVASRCP